jgi:hypothetical protein
MEVREALSQITEIRAHIARTETFRGYRSLTVAVSGLMAVVGGVAQSIWIPAPRESIASYLALWIGAAVSCLATTALEITVRCYWEQSEWAKRMTWKAVEQFLPCVLAGGMLTFVMVRFANESLWLLPGLWSMVFALGVFVSCRLLPRHLFWVGVYYLIAGACCVAWANGPHAFSPWAMIGTFGGGQTLTAVILYCTLERNDDPQQSATR